MTTYLHQLLAPEKDIRTRGDRELTQAYHTVQSPGLFTGLTKTYAPLDPENDPGLPGEDKPVQETVAALLEGFKPHQVRMIDLEASKNATNRTAHADVVLEDGSVLFSSVAAETLLYLEKRMIDYRTLISKLPTRDPSKVWAPSEVSPHVAQTPVTTTVRTAKHEYSEVVVPQSTEHPAQVRDRTKDVIVGHWHQVTFSGAISMARKQELLDRAESVLRSIKKAREKANREEVVEVQLGETLLNHLFS